MISKIIYQKRWMMFWWFIGLAAMTTVTTVFFPAFKGTNIGQVFNSLPVTVQHIVGSAASYQTLNGYISQEIFGLRAPLLTIILSIIVFNSLMVSEERKGILEAQVSLPLSRKKILTSKLIAAITIIIIASIGLLAGVLIGLVFIHDHYSITRLLELTLSSVVIGIVFGLVTLTLNSIFGVKALVLGLSCAYAFLSYLLTSLVISAHSLRTVEKASLFHYYDTSGSFNYHNLLVLGYIGLALIMISFIFFTRRDIET